MKIVTDEAFLRQPSKPISVSKGLKLGRDMHNFLLSHNKRSKVKGVGLSAIQLGIPSQVFITSLFGKTMTFVNPRIVRHSNVQVPYKEGCLSFPGKEVNTYRWPWVYLECDNLRNEMRFGNYAPAYHMGTCPGPYDRLLEAVVIQHEYDHLQGILFSDRTSDLTTQYEGFRLGLTNQEGNSDVG